MLLAVRISSYGCTWEVWRALKKLELLSAAPRATLTLLSCSPDFPRASITRYTHAKHEPILNWSRKTAPCQTCLERRSPLNKTCSESKIELRNPQILKKMWKSQVSFCHRSSPVSWKAWTLPWKEQELKKYPRKTCGYGQPRGHLIRVLN